MPLAALAPAAPQATAAPEKNPATPAWPLLKDLHGKVVLVDFWASWCAPCLSSFPWMDDLQKRHGQQGLVVVAVNLDQDRALADAFLRKTAPQFRIEFDQQGTLAKQFGVQAMPTSFLIDRSGIVRWAYIECGTEGLAGLGKMPSDEAILAAARDLADMH